MVLVHGGLWEDMDAERFWVGPGVVAALEARGVLVLAPDRVSCPRSWAEEVAHLLPLLPGEPVTLVGGSNGCSVAARIAADHPERVGRLVLAWPATAGGRRLASRTSTSLGREGISEPASTTTARTKPARNLPIGWLRG